MLAADRVEQMGLTRPAQAQHTQVRVLGTRELGEIIAAVLPVRLYRPYQQRLAAEEMDP
jgi:hypothetical protein